MNRALIVIDAQNDFCAPNGVLSTKEAINAVPHIRELVEQFVSENATIYYTRDTHDAGYRWTQEGTKLPIEHCRYGSWGWQIVEDVEVNENEYDNVHHLNKMRFAYDSWEDEDLGEYDEIVVCGLVSSICVVANIMVIKSIWPELPIKFIAYASAGLNPDNHKAAIEVLRSCQVEVIE